MWESFPEEFAVAVSSCLDIIHYRKQSGRLATPTRVVDKGEISLCCAQKAEPAGAAPRFEERFQASATPPFDGKEARSCCLFEIPLNSQ